MSTALARSRGVIDQSYNTALSLKAAGILDLSPPHGISQFGQWADDTQNRERYALFRGWLYAAVNALASEAAGQPVTVAKLKGKTKAPKGQKSQGLVRAKMTTGARTKTASQEFEVLVDHPLMELLEQPNPMQTRWAFVYSFIANLNLTGWSYVVGGENEDGELEFYSLPTNWIKVDHKDGPFSRFRIVDPTKPSSATADDEWLTRENVAFAMLPNPADPRMAMPPATSQIRSIRIDDCIQASQLAFFDNGIFPGAIVTIGKDPHPDVPAGIRPRLSAIQRRQVTGAIRKVMGGVANYGNPAIVDGLIESIERLSMTSNEMGWEKSEDKIRTRILSAFGVHPYILGEPVGVGGYAQVVNIEKRFYKRVNTFLDMLSTVVTNFVGPATAKTTKAKPKEAPKKEDLLVWWEECQAVDPSLRWNNLNAARGRGDVSRNEIRAELNLPPDETYGDQTKTWTAADLNAIVAVQAAVGQGQMTPQQAAALYEILFDMDPADAKKIAGKAPPKPPPAPAVPGQQPGTPGTPVKPPGGPEAASEDETGVEPPTEEDAVKTASTALELAVKSLGLDVAGSGLPAIVAERLIEKAAGR
jgi:phage portal protein BeeE